MDVDNRNGNQNNVGMSVTVYVKNMDLVIAVDDGSDHCMFVVHSSILI